MRCGDLLAIVEAAYELGTDDEHWLRMLLEAAAPHLDMGMGLIAYTVDLSAPEGARIGRPVVQGDPRLAEATTRVLASAPPGAVAFGMSAAPGYYISSERVRREDRAPFLQAMSRAGMEAGVGQNIDQGRIIAIEPGGGCVAIIVPSQTPPVLSNEERGRWQQIAVHIGAALRLRRALAARRAAEDAILRVDGACEHAEAPAQSRSARDALREAVRSIDRARSVVRHDDQTEALEIWRGLCAGRWSLVDRFDSDGRRYIVALRNDPEVSDPRALSARERQVVGYVVLGHSNKLIGYALGLSTSTVAGNIKSAMRKLGASSRADLIRISAASMEGVELGHAESGE